MSNVFYLCDGKDETCGRNNCYGTGGPCHHTDKIEHALNFHKGIAEQGYWETDMKDMISEAVEDALDRRDNKKRAAVNNYLADSL